MQVFEHNPWFASLPPAEASALLDAGTPVRLAVGQPLFSQGADMQSALWSFCGVRRGLLKLSVLHAEGSEVILTVLEPGNWFGEGSMLDQQPRGHTAVALESSELLVVNAKSFAALMQRTAFAQAIARLLAGRLRLAYGLVGDSALCTTRERVARRLAMLAHGDVTQLVDGRTSITTSQNTLAMMLGISRPTLNRELQAIAKEGFIRLRYGRIEINDLPSLVCGGVTP